jgi:hypothetical protein
MTSEIAKQSNAELDGFAGFEDAIEGQERERSGLMIGPRIKFSNDAKWITVDDEEELPNDLELAVVNVKRIITQWGKDGKPVDHIELAPGQKFPDIAAMNEAVPKSEWRDGPGGLQGPYQGQNIVYLLDQGTMQFFTWPSAITTIGSAMCVRDIVDRTKWIRRFRGIDTYAVVTLGDKFMHTRFGGRQRPHFNLKRWERMGEGETPQAIEHKPVEIDAPSRAEDLKDEIPF